LISPIDEASITGAFVGNFAIVSPIANLDCDVVEPDEEMLESQLRGCGSLRSLAKPY
jgi:hypothetical protein